MQGGAWGDRRFDRCGRTLRAGGLNPQWATVGEDGPDVDMVIGPTKVAGEIVIGDDLGARDRLRIGAYGSSDATGMLHGADIMTRQASCAMDEKLRRVTWIRVCDLRVVWRKIARLVLSCRRSGVAVVCAYSNFL